MIARQIKAEVMFARGGDRAGARRVAAGGRVCTEREGSAGSLSNARVARAPTRARGRRSEASELADELIQLVTERQFHANRWATSLVFALDELGRPGDAAGILERLTNPTPLRNAALAYSNGDRAGAAEIHRERGNRTDEAYARSGRPKRVRCRATRPRARLLPRGRRDRVPPPRLRRCFPRAPDR
jgi:hypothetical protein